MKVLITGSEGFIGRNLVRHLASKGFEVVGTDLNSPRLAGDVTDERFVLKRLGEESFDAVVHLAAIVEIARTIADPYACYRTNVMGALNVLELARRKAVKRFVYSSSANVYGMPLELPVKETTPFNPRAPYDFSKVMAEYAVRSYCTHRGLPTVVLRSWKLFGEYDNPNTAIPRFIRACLKNEPISLYNGGRDTTDPVYVGNYCDTVELCLTEEGAVGEAFNIGTGGELSIRQIAESIKKVTGSSSELVDLPPRSSLEAEPMRSYPSIEKLEMRLGYRARISFEEGLARTAEWLKRSSPAS